MAQIRREGELNWIRNSQQRHVLNIPSWPNVYSIPWFYRSLKGQKDSTQFKNRKQFLKILPEWNEAEVNVELIQRHKFISHIYLQIGLLSNSLKSISLKFRTSITSEERELANCWNIIYDVGVLCTWAVYIYVKSGLLFQCGSMYSSAWLQSAKFDSALGGRISKVSW